MSTRWIVAEPHGDSWRGRHVQSDGYPTRAARNVWAIVKRDGIEEARKQLIEDHYGWSVIKAVQPDITGVKPPKEPESGPWQGDYNSAEYIAALFNPKSKSRGMYADGRFANVPGCGIAYTDTVIPKLGGLNGKPYQQSTVDDWQTPQTTSDSEYAYVIADDALWAFICVDDGVEPILIGRYEWRDPEPDWEAIEKVLRDAADAQRELERANG